MSLVGRSRSPVSTSEQQQQQQHLPGWQRDLILKKRAMNRVFPRLYPQAVENGTNNAASAEEQQVQVVVGAFHPEPPVHAPPHHNNKVNNESTAVASRAFTANWNGVRQQQQQQHSEKLSEPPPPLNHHLHLHHQQQKQKPKSKQQPAPAVVTGKQQSRFGSGSAYFTFNEPRMGEDKTTGVSAATAATNGNGNYNNGINAMNGNYNGGGIGIGELGKMVANGGTGENGYDDLGDEDYEYGPGIVNRLRSKFNSLTTRERELSTQVSVGSASAAAGAGGLLGVPGGVGLSPVRRVASLEQLLDMDEEESCAPPYPTLRYAQRSELLKRARSMETLSAIDRGPGIVISASAFFGPRTSSGGGFFGPPLSPINDKVIIIEQTKPEPKTNGVSPVQDLGGATNRLPRAGLDPTWKPASNVALIDEELPKPDTVRKNKQIFEGSEHPESNTIVLRTRKLTPPPKPPGLKPGVKPAGLKPGVKPSGLKPGSKPPGFKPAGLKSGPKPPPSPTPPSPSSAGPAPPKKVFTFLQEKERAEKIEQSTEASTLPPRTASPGVAAPRTPSPSAAHIVDSRSVSPSAATGSDATAASVTASPRTPSPSAAASRATSPSTAHDVVDTTLPPIPSSAPAPPKAVFAAAAAAPPPIPVSAPPPPAPTPNPSPLSVAPAEPHSVSIVGETWKPSANAAAAPHAALNGFDNHKTEPAAAAAAVVVKPVGAIKPFVQTETTAPVASVGRLVGANPGYVSTEYNFVGKDVKPNIANTKSPFDPTPIRPAAVAEELSDDEDFSMDGLMAKTVPVAVDFVGDNVIVGRSALMKTRNKKLKLVFDDHALSTYEYPSESSLLEGETTESSSAVVAAPEEHSTVAASQGGAIKVRASIEMGPSVLKSTPAIGGSLGGLSSYTPMVVGSTEAFELGVSRAPPPPPAPTKTTEADKDFGDGEESLFLKPAADDDNVLWSSAATSDILF